MKKRKRPKIIEFDRVESAFRRLDINNDGVLDWNEFKKVNSNSITFNTFHRHLI